MAWYCIVFDIIAVYCMSPHYILWYGMVLYFIWSYCTVSHCYVPLLQRAGELPRSASSHFIRKFYSEAQFGVVDKSIETDFRSTSSDKNCHQIWQQLQRQGQGATKKGGYSSEKL